MIRRRRTSPLWKHFKRMSSHTAKCNICKKLFSYKSSISNLRRHLMQHGTFESADLTKISVPSLTELIQKYPCLWDTRCDSFANTDLKFKTWQKIADKLYPGKETHTYAHNISEQFNDMRKKFFLNRSKHSKELSFMEPLLEIHQPSDVLRSEKDPDEIDVLENSSKNRVEDENNTAEPPRLNSPQVTEETCRPHGRPETPNGPLLDCTLQLTNADDDTLFLLSLVDEIKSVPLESAMMFKAQLVTKFGQLVKTYENKNTS